jgi:hypothetical protein
VPFSSLLFYFYSFYFDLSPSAFCELGTASRRETKIDVDSGSSRADDFAMKLRTLK